MVNANKNKHNLQDLVSVIVPFYNDTGTIDACIESVLAQTYSNIEVILVDDGSEQVSSSICDKLAEKDDRIKVIHKPNGGVSSARNTGLKVAKGDWICFIDSDDEVDCHYVEYMRKAIETEDNMVVSGVKVYHQKLTQILNYEVKMFDLLQSSYDEHLTLYEEFIMAPVCGKLFSKKIILEKELLFNENLPCGEDHLFVFEYLKYCKKICFLSDCLYNYFAFRSGGKTRFFPLQGQILIYEAKARLIEEVQGDEYAEKYLARMGLHNFRVRVNYLAKRKLRHLSELEECRHYYWTYIEPFINDKTVFIKSDWEWFNSNRKIIKNRNMSKLYKLAKRDNSKPLKKRIVRKLKRILP